MYRVWERVRKREKKIGSRDYSYVVHLYLQEYTCVYTTNFNRSIYINRRLFGGEKKSSSERKLIGAKFFNSISTLASDFEYHLSGFFFLPNRFARFFFSSAFHSPPRSRGLFSRRLEKPFFSDSFRSRTLMSDTRNIIDYAFNGNGRVISFIRLKEHDCGFIVATLHFIRRITFFYRSI